MSKEICEKIRKELKAIGYNSRQISVTSRGAGYEDSIKVTLKVLIPIAPIEKICEKYESVRYCEYSQEILAGGNTFVNVRYSWELLRDEASKIHELAKKIDAIKPERGYYQEIAKNEKVCVLIGYNDLFIRVNNDDISNERYTAHNFYAIAESLTLIKANYGELEINTNYIENSINS